MTLEELCAHDVSVIENKFSNEVEDPVTLGVSLVTYLRNMLTVSPIHYFSVEELVDDRIKRVDHFFGIMLNHKLFDITKLLMIRTVCSQLTLLPNARALNASITSASLEEFESVFGKKGYIRKHVAGKVDAFKGRPISKDTAVSESVPDTVLLTKLATLCGEYKSWFERMRADSKTADPKNHPNRHQLKERDDIHLQINALATPDVILKLVNFAITNGE